MLTTRAAHTLLTNAHAASGRIALAHALGFTTTPHRLSARPLAALGFTNPSSELHVARFTRDADWALLLIENHDPTHWRDSLRRITTHLDRLADSRRYLIVLHTTANGPLAIATSLSSARGPRLAVLTTAPHDVVDSDAQTVAALAVAWHSDPTTTCLRFHELLGRHAIGRRFFRALESHVTDIADAWPTRLANDERRTLALIHVARLLFLKFIETKGWLANDRAFLARHADDILASGGRLTHRLIAPLTFGTLNTPARNRAPAARAFGTVPFLNGGLFAASPLERRARHPHIRDELLAPLLLDTLSRFRFTAREDTRTWSEAAIDPDLLGRTFEALMDTAQRRGSGTFYTPASIVASLVDDALTFAIRQPPSLVRSALAGESVPTADSHSLLAAIDDLRVLDPACGSGSILVATLERLSTLRTQLGDHRPTAVIRRHVLTHSIFGVDIAPMAVWLCELRLWLSVVIDDDTTHPADITPLPNLDHHIRIGDALGNDAFSDYAPERHAARISQLREHYARSTGARKRTCATRIDSAERACARRITTQRIDALQHERIEMVRLARNRNLFDLRNGLSTTQRRRLTTIRTLLRELRATRRRLDEGGAIDFDFRTHFSDAATAGGFDLVIGNPPWVRSHHLDAATRANLRTRFADVTGHATGPVAFGVQTDIAIPFTQRGLQLTRPDGTLAFLLPAKLWRSVSAGALRQYLLQHATPTHLRDHSANAGGFSAAVYPSAIVLQHIPPRSGDPAMHTGHVDCHSTNASGAPQQFRMPAAHLPVAAHPGAPWRVIPENVRVAADTLAHAGTRWMDSILPSPSLGIKTGCNEAFLLNDADVPHALRPWARPVMRGDQVRAWHAPDSQGAIVVPTDPDGRMLTRLPAPLQRHFAQHERALGARTDLRPREPWWSLFRTDLLTSSGWRVVWADIGRSLRATILAPHNTTVPRNTCYGVRLHDPVDAHALAALLNAPTTTAWLSLVAEPARGGYFRFLGWTVLALPMPHWHRTRELLAPIAARFRRGEAVNDETLHRATLEAYGIRHEDVAPLLDWTTDTSRPEREHRARAAS
ncbi:MAG: N-6 DNA methylase [Gemmatimonadaceae bacterium]|nr:N-6 DNA methylase [Gemmatimonadaceae bacterium]